MSTPWKGTISVEDTALAVTDTGGDGTQTPIIYLNGQFATQMHWKKVIALLGTSSFRHITYDERARGKSDRSADYSFEACVRDVDAVLRARGVSDTQKVLVVGWSYGAYVAAHWASRNADRCLGAVFVDGAYPYDWLDEAQIKRIRVLFRRIAWLMPLLRPVSLAARMSAAQMAECNIELGVVSSEQEMGPVLERIAVPARYVMATGTSFGSGDGDELEKIRQTANSLPERNANIRVSARVKSSHLAILRKDSPAVVNAVNEVIACAGQKPAADTS